MNTTPLPVDYGLLLIFALIGLIAGAVRSAQKMEPRAGIREIIVQGAGGAFTSFCVGLGCLAKWGPDQPYISMLIAGVGGWGGTVLVDIALSFAVRTVNKRIEKDTP